MTRFSTTADLRHPKYQEIKSRVHSDLLNRLNLERLTTVKQEVAELREHGVAGTPAEAVDILGRYVEAGAQRYFHHTAARLSPAEAARMAAALPLPKERAVISPSGFTRRYGNMIQARIGVVRRDGLDACVYG